MKKILSGLTILVMTIMIAGEAGGAATITDVRNSSGVSITSSTSGGAIRVVGNDFESFQVGVFFRKVLILEFNDPESFSADLEVSNWSNTSIDAAIPTSIADHLSGDSITGALKIIKINKITGASQPYSNEVSFTINPVVFRTPPAEVMGVPIGGDEPEFEAVPQPLTVMHKDEPLSAEMPKQEVTGTFEGETELETKSPVYEVLQDAEITGVAPDAASPGEEINIEGRYFYSQGDKIVSLYFVHPTVARSFYMDLEVVDWDENGIVARIPNLNEKAFRFSTPISTKSGFFGLFSSRRARVPYDTYEYLPPEIKRQLSKYTDCQIRIITFPDTLISNTKQFRLAPGG